MTDKKAPLPKLENPKLDGLNPHFNSRYSTLGEVLRVLQPIFDAGFTVEQSVVVGERCSFFISILRDPEGTHIKTVKFPFLHADNYHKLGSALTYSRRYGLCLLFNLVGEDDDDGNLAAGSKPKTTTTSKPRRRAAVKRK